MFLFVITINPMLLLLLLLPRGQPGGGGQLSSVSPVNVDSLWQAVVRLMNPFWRRRRAIVVT